MLKTDAIKEFLKSTGNFHLTELYNYEMEVQVNVARDEGTRVKGTTYSGHKWSAWTDGSEIWKSFRIPLSANSSPQYSDRPIGFSLARRAEAIGMTGWNWVRRESVWVGFDFDSITNHEKAGLSDSELEQIKESVAKVPWVTLQKSTSGKGLHLYVFLEPGLFTATHTEHAAIAKAILNMLSAEIGYNLSGSVDTCGGVLWCFHRKQNGTDGFTLLKKGTQLELSKIPSNWKDYINSSARRKKKVAGAANVTDFDSLLASMRVYKLDSEHKRLLNWFCESSEREREWWWDADLNMLVCHTLDLAKAHKSLDLKGFFLTSSSGSSDQNCFAFPSETGSWVIRRHGMGTSEHPSWMTDSAGWTKCMFNAFPDYEVCARTYGGIENTKGEYVFTKAEDGLKSLLAYGISITLENSFLYRPMYVKEKGDNKVIVALDYLDTDATGSAPASFLISNNKKRWERIIHKSKPKKEIYSPDHLIRHIVSNGSEAGWYIKINDEWIYQPKSNVSTVLTTQSILFDREEIEKSMGKTILNPWKLVNIPFSEEYPGNRQWNKDCAALSTDPVEGSFDTWLKVFSHVGHSLDSYILENEWCSRNGIVSGLDYLLCWTGNLFQKPTEPLPYLFLVGGQNTGKSTIHEALAKLFKNNKGYTRADNALTSQGGFNAELENAVLCVVEETNLSKNKEASNRIKDWVTGKTISIRALYKNSYDICNTTHWIQCANDLSYCPILPGDTRISVINVPELPSNGEIPKYELFKKLEEEKAAFLYYVLNLDLPDPEGRLSLPVINTALKEDIISYSQSDLERFLVEKTKICLGHSISFEDFYQEFFNWLSPEQRTFWTESRVSKEYPKLSPYCKGKYGDLNKTFLGNITFDLEANALGFKFLYNSVTKRIYKNERDSSN